MAKTLIFQCWGVWVQSLVRKLDPTLHNEDHNSRSLMLQLRPDAENKFYIYIYMSQIVHEAIAFGSIHYLGHTYPRNLLMVHLKFKFN